MGKKLTEEYVREKFLENGCQLISSYVNARKAMEYICNCGGISKIRWDDFRKGKRCRKCGFEKSRVFFAYTLDFVKQYFLNYGCKCLADKYINNTTKMLYICVCGDVKSITFADFLNGKRCWDCGVKSSAQKQSHTFEYVRKFFENRNYILKSNEYKNAYSKLDFICPNGHSGQMAFTTFQQGSGCYECGRLSAAILVTGTNNYSWIVDRSIAKFNRKFRCLCYDIIRNAYVAVGKNKEDHSYNILGYSPKELFDHISSFPNWQYLKNQKWHLDHIFPIKAFLDYNILDVKLINCLGNLRPILPEENWAKKDKYDRIKFIEWLSSKIITDYQI